MSQEDAFAAGKDAGNAANREAIKAGINDTTAGNLIQGYSNAPPAQSGYWTGNKTLVAPAVAGGQTLQTDCLNTVPTDPVEKARCEAIRAVVGSNAMAPAYSGLVKKTDAIYLTGKAVGNDPESIAGSINGTYTACTTETLTTPGDMILETCDEAMTNATLDCVMGQEVTVDADHLYQCMETMSTLNSGQCTVGTVVQVDADANYQCEKTEKAYQTFNCDRTANVIVTTSTVPGALNCVPGTLLATYTRDTIPYSGASTSSGKITGRLYCHNQTHVYATFIQDSGPGYRCQGSTQSHYLAIASTYRTQVLRADFLMTRNATCAGNQQRSPVLMTITCGVYTCTGSLEVYELGNYYQQTSSSGAYLRPMQEMVTTYTAEVAGWDNQCATYEARAQ